MTMICGLIFRPLKALTNVGPWSSLGCAGLDALNASLDLSGPRGLDGVVRLSIEACEQRGCKFRSLSNSELHRGTKYVVSYFTPGSMLSPCSILVQIVIPFRQLSHR
jgi:hypothetical protein